MSAEGFGVLSEIDLAATMKAKIGVDMPPYLIMGACNPKLAHEALQLEDKIGLMLPCNVIVQDKGEGHMEISAIDPVASMQAIDNPQLKSDAAQVGEKLRRAIDSLGLQVPHPAGTASQHRVVWREAVARMPTSEGPEWVEIRHYARIERAVGRRVRGRSTDGSAPDLA